MTFDVIIVGGSYAGISAGMQLARARRRVLVMDTGLRRNRFARASHGFLGQDGRDPAAIADDARAQLLAYPSVEWLSEAAVAAKKEADGFVVKAANGERFTARRLILASGVADELPEIPGLAERCDGTCSIARIATATNWTAGRLAYWRPHRWPSTTP